MASSGMCLVACLLYVVCSLVVVSNAAHFMADEIVSRDADDGLGSSQIEVSVSIDISQALCDVDDYFLSYTIDSGEFDMNFEKLNFSSQRLHTLFRALSPSILRIGGSPADWLFFNKPSSLLKTIGLQPVPSEASKEVIQLLAELTRSTGNRLLFDLNLQLRYGQQWDPSNAIELLNFLSANGYGENIDWELGNEPQYNAGKGQIVLSTKQIANDFVVLHKLLQSFPSFNRSRIVGPDVVAYVGNREGFEIIQAVVNVTGSFLRAATFHHYYFRGDTATYKDYINPKYFSDLPEVIDLIRSSVTHSSYPSTAIWLGETSDSWHGGTADVSDRFVSGFLWLDKLGVSAEKCVGVVMRQTMYGYNYSMLDSDMHPNPDYWLSALHKALVGKTVLRVTLSGAPATTRVYAQCTATRSGLYRNGAVTVFALNSSPTLTSKLTFNSAAFRNQPIEAYVLSPFDGLLSKKVVLNGKQILVMPSETELPVFKPDSLPAGSEVLLAPLTFGFFVFPNANLGICQS